MLTSPCTKSEKLCSLCMERKQQLNPALTSVQNTQFQVSLKKEGQRRGQRNLMLQTLSPCSVGVRSVNGTNLTTMLLIRNALTMLTTTLQRVEKQHQGKV